MASSRQHAVLLIQRPPGWMPKLPTDLPTPLVYAGNLSLGDAAMVAREYNERALAKPEGFWAIAAKCLKTARSRRSAKGGAA